MWSRSGYLNRCASNAGQVTILSILQHYTRAGDLSCGSCTPHSIPVLSQTSATGFPLRCLLVPRVATPQESSLAYL